MRTDDLEGRRGWKADIHGTGGVVLHSLAQVGVRVFVPVSIGGGQLMMDILCSGKRRQCQQHSDQA